MSQPSADLGEVLEVLLARLSAANEHALGEPVFDDANGLFEHDGRRAGLAAQIACAASEAVDEHQFVVPKRATTPSTAKDREPGNKIAAQNLVLGGHMFGVVPLLVGVIGDVVGARHD